MPGIKELKTRIKSIQSTRKITRAMQMVSAAKMRKAQTAVTQSRTYAELAWELIGSLSGVMPGDEEEVMADKSARYGVGADSIRLKEGKMVSSPTIEKLLKTNPEAAKIGVILLTTNTGMVGGLNSNLINAVRKIEKENQSNKPAVEIVAYGRKGSQAMGRLGMQITADFVKQDKAISTEEIYPIAQLAAEMYLTGNFKKIYIAYNHFISTLSQKPVLKQLLPFENSTSQNNTNEPNPQIQMTRMQDSGASHPKPNTYNLEPIFEPSPKQILKHLLPRILESQIYVSVLESNASEHSARMVMMKNATESAGDLIADYTLTYNQLRQGKITTELAEITAGRIALE